MSVRRQAVLTVRCDENGCSNHARYIGSTIALATALATRARWIVWRHTARCGPCCDRRIVEASDGKI